MKPFSIAAPAKARMKMMETIADRSLTVASFGKESGFQICVAG